MGIGSTRVLGVLGMGRAGGGIHRVIILSSTIGGNQNSDFLFCCVQRSYGVTSPDFLLGYEYIPMCNTLQVKIRYCIDKFRSDPLRGQRVQPLLHLDVVQ